MSEATCKKCGKPGHQARGCKAPFSKSWKGRPAIKFLVRGKDGSTVEIAGPIPDDLEEEAWAFQRKMIRRML